MQTRRIDRWILTAVCVAGLALATWMAARWCRLARPETSLPLVGGTPGARRGLRSVAVTAIAAIVAGVLVPGLGGRLFMRVMAATSDDSVQGAITEADQAVGDVSLGGTIGLIVFGGLAGGLMGALIYRLLRPWLPTPAWKGGAIVGIITLGALGRAFSLLNPENIDFDLLSPDPLAVGFIVVGALLFGVVVASLTERLDRGMPELRLAPSALAYLPVAVMFLSPPSALAVIVSVALAALAPQSTESFATSRAAALVARGVIAIAFVAALAIIALDSVAIVT